MMLQLLSDPTGRAYVVASANPTPARFIGATGFSATSQLVIDTNAPSGSNSIPGGLRVNANGAIFGTTSLDSNGPDVYLGGTRISTLGQLVYEDNTVQMFGQGKGLRANGALAVTTVAPP